MTTERVSIGVIITTISPQTVDTDVRDAHGHAHLRSDVDIGSARQVPVTVITVIASITHQCPGADNEIAHQEVGSEHTSVDPQLIRLSRQPPAQLRGVLSCPEGKFLATLKRR